MSEIFCARLTQQTRSLGRPVADGRGLGMEQNIERVAKLICSQEDNLDPAKAPETLKS